VSDEPTKRYQPDELQALIISLRRACSDEPPMKSHARSPASIFDIEDLAAEEADEGGIGIAFTGSMHKYLKTNAPRWDTGPNPYHRPGTASILEVSDWCHAEHSTHKRPGRSRSLCAQMLFEVAVFGQEPEDIAWLHGIPMPQVERMLLSALRHAKDWRLIQGIPLHGRRRAA
jgi:hypothetical protein